MEYKELIEKVASRAWKANIGKLTESSLDKLRNSGILNYKKEIDGLNKGTENIVKKLGGIIDNSKKHKSLIKSMDEHSKAINQGAGYYKQFLGKEPKGKLSSFIGDRFAHNVNKNFVSQGRGFYTTTKNPLTNVGSDIVGNGNITDKLPTNLQKALSSRGLKPPAEKLSESARSLPKQSQDYINAILSRHEADEFRGVKKELRKNNYYKEGLNRGYVRSNMKSGHMTPEVLFRESANVAIAPKDVKKSIRQLREDNGDLALLSALGSNDYGNSGAFNPLKSRKAVNMQTRANKLWAKENGIK